MNSQDIRNLQEAYMEVVENQQLNELSVNRMLAYVKKGEKNREDLNKKWDEGTATRRERMRVLGREEGERRASDKVKKKTGKRPYQMNALDRARYAVTKEEYDLYDIILSHLLDEGYAETPEAAEAIMVNMSEDWREDIVEAAADYERPQTDDEIEQARNERRFGKQGFNQVGQTKLRRQLHKSQRGVTKKDARRWEGEK